LSGSSPDSHLRFLIICRAVLRVTLILLGIASLLLALVFASGCTRTVLVPESSPIRVGPATRARIYVMTDGEWELGANCVEIPEGWYCVPPSFVEEK